MRRQNRHRDESVGITPVQLWRQAGGFTTEDENEIRMLAKRRVPEKSLCSRREEIWDAEGWKLFLKRFPSGPYLRLHVFPVVKPRALQLPFLKRKAERTDQVQAGVCRETSAACVSGVPVNLRMDEYDVGRQLLPAFPVLSVQLEYPSAPLQLRIASS